MAPTRAPIRAGLWLEHLADPGSALRKRLGRACGGAPTAERLALYRSALTRYVELFGSDRPVQIIRAPGRLNVLGMHIDHRGGYVNPMALAQEVVFVFSANDDDLVDTANVDPSYGRWTFRIYGDVPPHALKDTAAWLDWTQALVGQRSLAGIASHWGHKLAAPGAYLAHFSFRGRRLRGLSGVMAGDIPPRVGLSSSSAVVVAMMMAMVAANRLPVGRDELVQHCGIAEWYVGTRGGFGDHAAILCAQAGKLACMRTVPELKIADFEPFPDDFLLLVFHSGFDADKTGAAGNTFNERTAGYELAEMLSAQHLRRRHAERWQAFAEKRRHLANTKSMHLGDVAEWLTDAQIYAMLETIPERANRRELSQMLRDREEALRRQFATHREPPEGYRLRGVLLYGIAECARAARGGKCLGAGDLAGFARLMNISHDGDRVSNISPALAALKARLDTTLEIWEQPGSYDCSTREIDSMVDIALSAGAVGAQVAGAGLGGSMMALVAAERKEAVIEAMIRNYFEPRGFKPILLEAAPSAGAAVV